MGWLVAALSGMQEEQLVQSHGREGQSSRTVFLCLLFSALTAHLASATGGQCVLALAMGLCLGPTVSVTRGSTSTAA